MQHIVTCRLSEQCPHQLVEIDPILCLLLGRKLIEGRLMSLSTRESPGMVQVCPETNLGKTYIHFILVEYATCPRDEQKLDDSESEFKTALIDQSSEIAPQ